MDFELSQDQRAFADTARAFAQAELAPHAARWDAEGIFPREAIAKAGELGFCGLYTPENAGGLALPRLDATLVFEEMAAVDPSTTAFIRSSSYFVATSGIITSGIGASPLLSATSSAASKIARACIS